MSAWHGPFDFSKNIQNCFQSNIALEKNKNFTKNKNFILAKLLYKIFFGFVKKHCFVSKVPWMELINVLRKNKKQNFYSSVFALEGKSYFYK